MNEQPASEAATAINPTSDLQPTAVGQLPHLWEVDRHPLTGQQSTRRAFVYDWPSLAARLKYGFTRIALAASKSNREITPLIELLAGDWLIDLSAAVGLPVDRTCWGADKNDGQFGGFSRVQQSIGRLMAERDRLLKEVKELRSVNHSFGHVVRRASGIDTITPDDQLMAANLLIKRRSAQLEEENQELRRQLKLSVVSYRVEQIKPTEQPPSIPTIAQQEDAAYRAFNQRVGQAIVQGLLVPSFSFLQKADMTYYNLCQNRAILTDARQEVLDAVDRTVNSQTNMKAKTV